MDPLQALRMLYLEVRNLNGNAQQHEELNKAYTIVNNFIIEKIKEPEPKELEPKDAAKEA